MQAEQRIAYCERRKKKLGGWGEAFIVEGVDRSVDRSIAQSIGRLVDRSLLDCVWWYLAWRFVRFKQTRNFGRQEAYLQNVEK